MRIRQKITIAALAIAFVGAGAIGIASDASAISVEPDDVPNQAYIIGTHMFTREVTDAYPGYITTSSIMFAAQTIEGDSLDDMQIYYKTSRGVWVNGLTNEEIAKPGTFTIETRNLRVACNLNATTIEEAVCMQDMNELVKSTLSPNTQYELIDVRDEKSYRVAKLADGEVWMMRNLALGGTTPITLTTTNSDVAATFTMPAVQTSVDKSWFCDSDKYCSTVRVLSTDNGNTYTWYTATANTISYSQASEASGGGQANYSICPKGWKLPSSEQQVALYNATGSNRNDFMAAIDFTPHSGAYYSANYSVYSWAWNWSGWWSSSYIGDADDTYSKADAYVLSFGNSDDINDGRHEWASEGYSVRCVAR